MKSDTAEEFAKKQAAEITKSGGTLLDEKRAIFKKAGMPEKSWPQFAVMNGRDLDAVPPAEALIKTVK